MPRHQKHSPHSKPFPVGVVSKRKNWKGNVKIIGNKFSKSVENGTHQAKRVRQRRVQHGRNSGPPRTHSSMSLAGHAFTQETTKGKGCKVRGNRIYNKLNCNNSASIKNHNSWNSTARNLGDSNPKFWLQFGLGTGVAPFVLSNYVCEDVSLLYAVPLFLKGLKLSSYYYYYFLVLNWFCRKHYFNTYIFQLAFLIDVQTRRIGQ